MKKVWKYTGIFTLLAGVLVLILPHILNFQSNTTLLVGLGLIICGFIGYIIMNK